MDKDNLDETMDMQGTSLAGPSPSLESLFPGDSELASLMRETDWARTALGPPET